MQFRHECKTGITIPEQIAIRQRLRAIAKSDPHTVDGKYLIRSLYFDTPEDKALVEKQSGVNRRHKFRIRYYNGDTSMIRLEKKCKTGGLGTKVSAPLSEEQADRIVRGELSWMRDSEESLIRELYTKMVAERLQPKTIVDYTREPFIFAPGNVRVTLDYDIRTGLVHTGFLDRDCVMIPAAFGTCILEVKWDDFLPEIIRDVVQIPGGRIESFSKYEVCRYPVL